MPGLYLVKRRNAGSELVRRSGVPFAVIANPRESDTTRIDSDELTAHLGSTTGKDTAGPTALTTSVAGTPGARSLSNWLLLAAVLALLAVGWLLWW